MTARKVVAVGLIVACFLAGVLAGVLVGRATAPICHAPTEDSRIVDCDYRDGGWRP